MSVLFDNAASSTVLFTATSGSISAFVVGSGANRAAQIHITMGATTATSIICDIGGTSGVLVTGTDTAATVSDERTMIFGVTAPPSGSRTVSASWGGAVTADIGVITVSNCDQTTPVTNGTFNAATTSAGTAVTVSVTSVSGDLTASCCSVYADVLNSGTQTIKWGIDSSATAGSIGPGTGTTVHSWTKGFSTDSYAISGANFKAVSSNSGIVARAFHPGKGVKNLARFQQTRGGISSKNAYILTVDPATYNLAGATAQLLAARRLTLSPGTYNITGSAGTLKLVRAITALAGTYNITGASAQVLKASIIKALAGSYNENGVAATLAAAHLLSLGTGSYTITGASAQLLAKHIISAAPGSYILSGAPATLLATRLLTATAGNYTLAGQSAQLLAKRILSGAPGVYLINGAAATFIAPTHGSFTLDVLAGSFALTGTDAKAKLDGLENFPASGGGAFVIIIND